MPKGWLAGAMRSSMDEVARPLSAARTAAFVLLSIATAEAEMRLEPHDGGVRVFHNDKLFTDYRIDMGPKPILWPIHNRKGVALTRPVPENSAAAKGLDHPHQKSMWFAH